MENYLNKQGLVDHVVLAIGARYIADNNVLTNLGFNMPFSAMDEKENLHPPLQIVAGYRTFEALRGQSIDEPTQSVARILLRVRRIGENAFIFPMTDFPKLSTEEEKGSGARRTEE